MKWIKTYNEAIGPKLTKKVYDEESGLTQSVSDIGMKPSVYRSASSIATSNRQKEKVNSSTGINTLKNSGLFWRKITN